MTVQEAIDNLSNNTAWFQVITADTEDSPTQYFPRTDITHQDKSDADTVKESMNILLNAINDGTLHL